MNENVKQVTWDAKFMNKKQRNIFIERLENYRNDMIEDSVSNKICAKRRTSKTNSTRRTRMSHSDSSLDNILDNSSSENDESSLKSKTTNGRRRSTSFSNDNIEDSKETIPRRRHSMIPNASIPNTQCELEIPFQSPVEDTLLFQALVKGYSDRLLVQNNCDSENLEKHNEEMLLQLY